MTSKTNYNEIFVWIWLPGETEPVVAGKITKADILCGNTDDHARNHAAFWDGKHLTLTPAYDLCPQMRQGGEASQAMMISGSDRSSRLITCLAAAHRFMLSDAEARAVIDAQVEAINSNWDAVCDEAELSPIDRTLFKDRLFLNAYAFEGYTE